MGSNHAAQRVPVAGGMPLVGALPALVRRPMDFLLGAMQRYGDLYALDLGVAELVVLNHPRHAAHVLRQRSHLYSKAGPVWDLLRTVIGNGLATSEGEAWRRQRRLVRPGFHRRRLADLAGLMT